MRHIMKRAPEGDRDAGDADEESSIDFDDFLDEIAVQVLGRVQPFHSPRHYDMRLDPNAYEPVGPYDETAPIANPSIPDKRMLAVVADVSWARQARTSKRFERLRDSIDMQRRAGTVPWPAALLAGHLFLRPRLVDFLESDLVTLNRSSLNAILCKALPQARRDANNFVKQFFYETHIFWGATDEDLARYDETPAASYEYVLKTVKVHFHRLMFAAGLAPTPYNDLLAVLLPFAPSSAVLLSFYSHALEHYVYGASFLPFKTFEAKVTPIINYARKKFHWDEYKFLLERALFRFAQIKSVEGMMFVFKKIGFPLSIDRTAPQFPDRLSLVALEEAASTTNPFLSSITDENMPLYEEWIKRQQQMPILNWKHLTSRVAASKALVDMFVRTMRFHNTKRRMDKKALGIHTSHLATWLIAAMKPELLPYVMNPLQNPTVPDFETMTEREKLAYYVSNCLPTEDYWVNQSPTKVVIHWRGEITVKYAALALQRRLFGQWLTHGDRGALHQRLFLTYPTTISIDVTQEEFDDLLVNVDRAMVYPLLIAAKQFKEEAFRLAAIDRAATIYYNGNLPREKHEGKFLAALFYTCPTHFFAQIYPPTLAAFDAALAHFSETNARSRLTPTNYVNLLRAHPDVLAHLAYLFDILSFRAETSQKHSMRKIQSKYDLVVFYWISRVFSHFVNNAFTRRLLVSEFSKNGVEPRKVWRATYSTLLSLGGITNETQTSLGYHLYAEWDRHTTDMENIVSGMRLKPFATRQAFIDNDQPQTYVRLRPGDLDTDLPDPVVDETASFSEAFAQPRQRIFLPV